MKITGERLVRWLLAFERIACKAHYRCPECRLVLTDTTPRRGHATDCIIAEWTDAIRDAADRIPAYHSTETFERDEPASFMDKPIGVERV